MKKLVPLGLGLVLVSPIVLQTAASAECAGTCGTTETATGVVFEDLDEDNEHDEGEPGVPGVSVSNGREVVLTDEEGRYRLGVTDETIVFITKPADYMVPVDDVQLPQFYYVHYPNGTPVDLEYGGIEPTGPLPESVDFPLRAQAEPDQFEVVVFADPQTRNVGELEAFRKDVVAELTGSDAAFGLTVGDLVNDPLDLFEPHNEVVSEIGLPWWNLPGNHDMNYDAPDDTYATQTYKSIYGPTDYSLDYGQVHFVNMDNVDYLGQTAEGENGEYRGYLNDAQLEWLKNDLAHVPADKLVLIATHIPLRIDAIGEENINTVNLDELFEVLEGREHLYAISGHDTSNSWQKYIGDEGGWTGEDPFLSHTLAEVRGGGWTKGPVDERGVQAADMADGNPNGYYTISFDGNQYTPRFKPASLPEDFQMRLTFQGGGHDQEVLLPSGPSGSGGFSTAPQFHPRDWAKGEAPQVTVNVFDGGERHQVEARVDHGEFSPMAYNPPFKGLTDGDPNGNLDPYVSALFERLEGTTEEPAEPQPSSHLWMADLPSGLEPGWHVLTVRSTDPYGQVSETFQLFEVVTGRPGSPQG
ncbi:calcineurin-like phosphoesterase C-terminal domain-containing protein [Modestobacter sp. SYSU DS0875]